jgi:hypothetical protein
MRPPHMGRYKQSRYHHEHEFEATLPMMLAEYWWTDHTHEIINAIETIDPDALLYWTEGSLALGQVAEYIIFNRLTAVQDLLLELEASSIGKDIKDHIDRDIRPRGMGSHRGERRALTHKLQDCMWCPAIANELEDIIAEFISRESALMERISSLRKQANKFRTVSYVHNS